MAIKKNRRVRRVKLNKGKVKVDTKVIIGVVALLVALPIAAGAALQQTDYLNYASEPKLASNVVNLNTGRYITGTNNSDGSMGPDSYLSNYSHKQPRSKKGKLQLQIKTIATKYLPPSPTYGYEAPTGTSATPTQTPTPTPYDIYVTPTPAEEYAELTPTLTSNNPYYIISKEKNYAAQTTNSTDDTPTPAYGSNSYSNSLGIKSLKLVVKKAEVLMISNDRSRNRYKYSDKGNSKNKWETLKIPSPLAINLIDNSSYDETIKTLGITELAAGRYSEVRLYISEVKAKLTNGKTISVKINGKDRRIRVAKPFTITRGKTTKLTLNFDIDNSVYKVGSTYNMRPVIGNLYQE